MRYTLVQLEQMYGRDFPHLSDQDQSKKQKYRHVAKMASHAIFQYIVLAIDNTHNTWTNMIVKMIILRLFRFK